MKKLIFSLLILKSIVIMISRAQELPLGYILQYSQNFSDRNSVSDFNFSNPDSWNIIRQNNNYIMKYSAKSNYIVPAQYPNIIGLLSKQMYGDFIMDVDYMQTGGENNMSNFCIIFGLKDSTHYCYIHLAPKADENSHNVFIVNDTISTKAGIKLSDGVNWNYNKWQKVRVKRNILDKTITVYFNDMAKPVIEAKDRTYIMGYIGFGSVDEPGMIDNIKIWAPTSVPGEANIFNKISLSGN
ncbi:MAG: hypothetical protein JSV22_01255 [Bacteroidales bacterium]|nr:MAG: hypothetical protein JSV22_01255 [Bacteroidales bacterium]